MPFPRPTFVRCLRRHSLPPSIPSANATHAAVSSSECTPCLSFTSRRGVSSSLAAEDVSGHIPEAAGEGDGSERSSEVGALWSLFARPSTSSIPELAANAGGVESVHGGRSRFSSPQSRMRPVRPAVLGSSVQGGRVREVSPEMASLVKRLHEEGYLKKNFLQEGDSNQIVASACTPGLLVTAAEKFGEDHREIAKWLSGSSLKKVALSGCPSTARRTVFAAKRLRSFFFIQEDIVCRGCTMKNSCKFVNRNVNRENKLILADVMRILTVYAWDFVPNCCNSQKGLYQSVAKSLKEVMSLTS